VIVTLLIAYSALVSNRANFPHEMPFGKLSSANFIPRPTTTDDNDCTGEPPHHQVSIHELHLQTTFYHAHDVDQQSWPAEVWWKAEAVVTQGRIQYMATGLTLLEFSKTALLDHCNYTICLSDEVLQA
jgi:hypothetical protein